LFFILPTLFKLIFGKLPIEYFLYILLHEISHQYQYKKYGKNLTLDIYIEGISIEDSIKKLMYLEKIADRLSIKKMKSLSNKLKTVIPRYLNLEDTLYFEKYISDIRKKIKDKGCESIEEVNSVLYENVI
jgi:hypothetical protein